MDGLSLVPSSVTAKDKDIFTRQLNIFRRDVELISKGEVPQALDQVDMAFCDDFATSS
jgi:hypothetical protein